MSGINAALYRPASSRRAIIGSAGSRRAAPGAFAQAISRLLLFPFLCRRYRVSAVDRAGLGEITPPYIVVANHTNFWDPFWINAYVRHPIQFVTSDNIFRNPLSRVAMRICGAIPKSKLMNDTTSVSRILRAIRTGGVIGIFPEGARTYDGRTIEPSLPVSRLIKRLGVPVVSVTIKGGYLSRPRWARSVRRGEVWLEFRRLFEGQELAALTADEVHRRLRADLAYDETKEQQPRLIPFRSDASAEYLERLLFLCPQCRGMSTLHSSRATLSCTSCSYAVFMDECGFFRPRSGPLFFTSVADWNAWQLSSLDRMVSDRTIVQLLPLRQQRVTLKTGYRDRPLKREGFGSAELHADHIEFRSTQDRVLSFRIRDIAGMNVQNREKLEFYYDGQLIRLDFSDPRASSHLWERATTVLARVATRENNGLSRDLNESSISRMRAH